MQSILQKKSLILSVIIFIFFCSVFIFLYEEINKNESVSEAAEQKWQEEATNRENTKSLINSIKSVETEKNLLENHFVKSSDIVPFLDSIENLAQNAGVKAEITSVDIILDNSSLAVQMKASGSFEMIYKFILFLENSPYDLKFISMDIQNQDLQNSIVDKSIKTKQWSAIFQIKLLSFVNQ